MRISEIHVYQMDLPLSGKPNKPICTLFLRSDHTDSTTVPQSASRSAAHPQTSRAVRSCWVDEVTGAGGFDARFSARSGGTGPPVPPRRTPPLSDAGFFRPVRRESPRVATPDRRVRRT